MEHRTCIMDLKVDDQIRFGSKPYVFVVRTVMPSDAGTRVSYSPIAHPRTRHAIDMTSTTVVYKLD